MGKEKIHNQMHFARDIARDWQIDLASAEGVLARMKAKTVYGLPYALEGELDDYLERLAEETRLFEIEHEQNVVLSDALLPAKKHLTRLGNLHPICGVYFLIRKKKIVYIGQSVNVLKRVASHADKEFDDAYFLPVPKKNLDSVEGSFIRRFRPPLNGTVPPGERERDAKTLKAYGFK